MEVTYLINFYEPWQGVRCAGEFTRWVKDTDEAFADRRRYEQYYKEKYGDDAEVFIKEIKE